VPAARRFQAGCAATPEAIVLAFVPVTLDLYRTVKRHLHWTLQNLVAFADRSGRCFPSVRTLAALTETSKSTVGRHLQQLAADGIIQRQRRPGGGCAYTIDKRFLPAARGVSHRRETPVPPARTEENQAKKTGSAPARFAGSVPSGYADGLPDMTDQWRVRVAGWVRSNRKFWLPMWGPRPDEAGCFAPLTVLRGELHSG
jgi:hypothetical protein